MEPVIQKDFKPVYQSMWIGRVFERVRDTSDKRLVFISLSDKSREAMAGYFAAIEDSALAYAA